RRSAEQRLRQAETELSALAARLELLSPLQTLNRGYAVVSCEGRAVRDAARLAIGQTVDIRLAQGRARARVEHTEED
ncbi:MAG: exodeoxyribonuclease VII large subunit, partial [Firmicutes bacterium]|nr:exodeoxyribonuclease VII large subunit [Bacillota bacterium]